MSLVQVGPCQGSISLWNQKSTIPKQFWGAGTSLGRILLPMEAEGRLIGGLGAEPPGILSFAAHWPWAVCWFGAAGPRGRVQKYSGFRISLFAIAPRVSLLWGGSTPPHPSEKSAFGLQGPHAPPNLGPRAPKPRLGLWTWSYLVPKWVFGKLKNKKGPEWAHLG